MELPEWIDEKGVIDESMFCIDYMVQNAMYCLGGRFYGPSGIISDEEVRAKIYATIACYTSRGLYTKVDALMKALKLATFRKPQKADPNEIIFSNGILNLYQGFREEMIIHPLRLNVAYNPFAQPPQRWLQFLGELLEEEDIQTLQEYLGYCLIPTNKGQKMLMIIGRGGEGKSQIGHVMQSIFGSAMSVCSIQKVEHNRFSRADLEGKLLMVDDDMEMSGLRKTNYIKSIITAERPMDVERKGIQSYQANLYARFLCFGNGALTALYDHSDGFFRRQIILNAKPRRPDRADDPFLEQRLCQEKERIVFWMLQGLERLIRNNYQFTQSSKTKDAIQSNIRRGNNLESFLESEGYLYFSPLVSASTKGLYECYRRWCEDNAEYATSMATFATEFANQAEKYGLESSNHIRIADNRQCRGYYGVEVL